MFHNLKLFDLIIELSKKSYYWFPNMFNDANINYENMISGFKYSLLDARKQRTGIHIYAYSRYFFGRDVNYGNSPHLLVPTTTSMKEHTIYST